MNWASHVQRWTMRTIHGLVLSAALLGTVRVASAQSPAPAANPAANVGKTYSRSLSFDLPVRIEDPEFRASLSEVRLYVKPAGGPWSLQEKGPPTLTRFQCRVPQDGEYWYTLVTVDRAGRPSVADVTMEPPSQRVVVDSAPPVIQVQATTLPEGDLGLRCTITDANPDHASLRAVCRTTSGDVPLESVPNQPGCFRVKGQEMLSLPVMVSVSDFAKNVATREVNLRELIALSGKAPTGSGPAPLPLDGGHSSMRPDWKGPGPVTEAPSPIQKTEASLPAKNSGPSLNPGPRGDLPPVNNPLPLNPPPPPAMANLPTPVPLPSPTETVHRTLAPAPRSNSTHQIINTQQASLEYRIDQVGPSGVGKVEIYMTPDNGQNWHRIGEDADKRSPAEVNLPGDGLYGIRIVVANGNGFGGKAPVRGDAPQCTIEVDTTSPFVQLRSTEVIPSAGHVEIRWNATDKNLGSEPVSLSYRTRTDGPWQVIAKNVKNDGVYRWTFPRDAGGQFYFKVEVADQAGNVSQDISRQPVVIDMTEPRATVVGVSGSGVGRQ